MVNKSLILAFSAMAAAAPQLGALGGLGGLGGLSSLKPGSKAASADKAAPSGESIPDGLNYNKPLEDEDETKDWSKWEYNEEDYLDPEDPGTVGSTVENKAEPENPYEEFPSTTAHSNITTSTTLRIIQSTSTPVGDYIPSTTLRQVASTIPAYKPSTTSTTLRQVQSTTPAQHYATTARNELPAYPAPVKQENEIESYEAPVKSDVVHSTSSIVKPNVQTPYQSSTTLRNEVPEPYHSTTVQAAVQEPYHSTTAQAAVQEPYHTTTVQANVQEPYHSTTLQNEVAQPYTTSVQANVQSAYRRRDLQGYGKAEFEKQSHVPTTTAAPACAIKSSAVAQPAVVSSAPRFGQTEETQVSSLPVAADMQSSSVWSAVPYSTPAVTQDAPKQQQTSASSTLLPASSSTPLADAVVPADAVILVNTLRPVNTTTESAAKNVVFPAESTAKLEKVASTTVSVATAPASKLLQTYYPTTTGAANATAGIAAATTGAISNNTLPEFEGAAVSSSSFIAGSVVALAIAAFAL